MLDMRFWKKVARQADGCWIWTAFKNPCGYGMFMVGKGIVRLAHRLSYMDARGDIPADAEIDHLCRVRSCVNPAHLEAVSHAENVRRGKLGAFWRDRTHCKNGHAFTPENTSPLRERGKVVGRCCLACKRDRRRRADKARLEGHPHDAPGGAGV
jgi:hypothetical protein